MTFRIRKTEARNVDGNSLIYYELIVGQRVVMLLNLGLARELASLSKHIEGSTFSISTFSIVALLLSPIEVLRRIGKTISQQDI